ncbi:unnamed protein product [Nezara viridula]|uniref:Rhythmically expressed gene 5 protein n=1 Tax=Nezara viridula TaxID=85310 RepID=A0A9P0EGN6_NEZVI|nr:unnamed protein product [Nezara viridula]
MSHLFNMFVKQVAEHCDSSNMPDCQKVLLVYGLTNLAKMEDDSLDKMDPYQRGANDIIWESMMHGSYKKKDSSLENRDYYSDAIEPSTSEGNQLGSQEEASSKVESYAGSRYIVGPMVVRVKPDGSPVPQDEPLPKDEDAEEYQQMRSKPIPSIAEISARHVSSSISTRRARHNDNLSDNHN